MKPWAWGVLVGVALAAGIWWTATQVERNARAAAHRRDSVALAVRLGSVTWAGQARANELTAALAAAAAARLDTAEAAEGGALAAAARHHAADTRLARVLDSLSSDAERVPVLGAQVDTLHLEVADLRTVVAEDSTAEAQLRHQLPLTDSLRQVDAEQATARLEVVRHDLQAARDSIARLVKKGRPWLGVIPRPVCAIGYGLVANTGGARRGLGVLCGARLWI